MVCHVGTRLGNASLSYSDYGGREVLREQPSLGTDRPRRQLLRSRNCSQFWPSPATANGTLSSQERDSQNNLAILFPSVPILPAPLPGVAYGCHRRIALPSLVLRPYRPAASRWRPPWETSIRPLCLRARATSTPLRFSQPRSSKMPPPRKRQACQRASIWSTSTPGSSRLLERTGKSTNPP